ncbi:MAG TPA: Gfo/Idh/MocA family oxidoreductase [Pirellulaceae bacterium]|nr:Gfo/Idh/MocA family oxidoreductase [Pirellulaceae bacterium]
MNDRINRRQFSKAAAVVATAVPMVHAAGARAETEKDKPVRIGFVGVGGRGTGMMHYSLGIKGVQVPAVCDVHVGRADSAASAVERAGQKRPEIYTKGETDYERMMDRDDLDAVFIATPWEWHTPMAVCAMKKNKYAGVEVPCAITLDECWQLVKTSEETGVPCMMMENWSFRRDNLAVLNMIRKGLFGEIVHCHCAHSHNCVSWYLGKGWPKEHLLERCADQYPTHSLGPVLSWMDINCGDRFDTVVSMASGQWGITDQLARKYGRDHALTKSAWKQGDVVSTMVKTVKGKTIVINMDMQLPRPYDNRWLIQGTRGLYNEQRDAVYLAGNGKGHNPEQWAPFGPYQTEHEHQWHRGKDSPGGKYGRAGHGGVDPLELELFVEAVRSQAQTPIDVYDSVVMSVIFPLSEMSISKGSQPVKCPDFTSGKWETTKPKFAVEG